MFVLKLLKNKELNKFNLKLLILALSVSSFIPKIAFYNQIDNFTPNTILIKYKSAASPIARLAKPQKTLLISNKS